MRTPGTFINYGTGCEYEAVSRAHQRVDLPAHVITDAISNGTLQVHLVSGCKCVTWTDLLRLKMEVAK